MTHRTHISESAPDLSVEQWIDLLNIRKGENDVNEQQVIEREFDQRSMKSKGGMIVVALVFVLIAAAFFATGVRAQTTCTVGGLETCFGSNKTTGESPLSIVVTWNVVGATTCTAGGGVTWTGSIPCIGTRTLNGFTTRRALTIDPVAAPTGGKMRLTWTPPTKNTDGSTLTNLGGYIVNYGTAPGSLTQSVSLSVPAATAYDIPNLTAGTWFATLQAATLSCFPASTQTCAMSTATAPVSRAVTTTPGGALPQLTLVIDPYTVPQPPTNVVATDVTAFRIDTNADGTLQATRIELVPLSTSCADDQCTVLTRRQ